MIYFSCIRRTIPRKFQKTTFEFAISAAKNIIGEVFGCMKGHARRKMLEEQKMMKITFHQKLLAKDFPHWDKPVSESDNRNNLEKIAEF